ncbi:hypothetical protein AMAG_00081 [Allomyces macrogynus ATCC 38327]|uniref:Cyclin n=1 Tax=Allomyces macrogynus (strain ATCC 38327) TaxID=578462 RepID=A0A0L0RVI4_ALLM3|nr:hypothetical protein AMAG_00081 [Allomyces macrogynus ATCC 38327]|eukprot:KNE54081.1 hypothetical protein AMAG_00081 [Allomyces macrogynus ATCC 38327]
MYLDRLAHLPSQALIVTSANAHRLLITATMVATKYWSDVFYTNAHYAKIGGLRAAQLSQLDLDFLMLLDFDLKLDHTNFIRYTGRLLVHVVAASATTCNETGSIVMYPTMSPEQRAALAQMHTITILKGYADDATMSPEQCAALAQMCTIAILEG